MSIPLRDTHTGDDLSERLHAKVTEWADGVRAAAAECHDSDGRKRCYVCHGTAHRLVAPGWGGVWSCNACWQSAKSTDPGVE